MSCADPSGFLDRPVIEASAGHIRRPDPFSCNFDNPAIHIDSFYDLATFAFTDLLRSELPSAHAAAPARRCGVHDCWRWLTIRAPGSHQFAVAPWTLSLNHKAPQKKRLSLRSEGLVAGVDRPSLLNGKPGRVAIAVAFQTSRIIALVFGVGQRLGFRDS